MSCVHGKARKKRRVGPGVTAYLDSLYACCKCIRHCHQHATSAAWFKRVWEHRHYIFQLHQYKLIGAEAVVRRHPDRDWEKPLSMVPSANNWDTTMQIETQWGPNAGPSISDYHRNLGKVAQ